MISSFLDSSQPPHNKINIKHLEKSRNIISGSNTINFTRVNIHITRRLYTVYIRKSQNVLVTPFITQERIYRFWWYLDLRIRLSPPHNKINIKKLEKSWKNVRKTHDPFYSSWYSHNSKTKRKLQNRVSYILYNSRTAVSILMIFSFLGSSQPPITEYTIIIWKVK